jgi:hypothetical protein
MFDPLPDSVIATLRSDETAALAAILIIGGAFPDVLAFAAKIVEPHQKPSVTKSRKPGNGRRGRRRGEGDRNDERLVAAMKANPNATIGALAEAIGKSRTSTVTALHRLRDADRAESLDRVWSLVEPPTPKETARWIEPVAASRRAREEERAHA